MNSLIIPPAANWFEIAAFACAPDNTVIYASRSDLVVIKPKELNQPAEIKVIVRAHQNKIKSVAVNPAWEKKKLAVTLAADRTVKLWNIEDYVMQLSHRAHTTSSAEVVGATFAGNDRIVSVSEDRIIIIWRFGPNELILLKDLLGTKPKVTCLSACPHLNWLVAFGLNNGLIVVTDLRKNGRVLYKLRRHDEAILSFSWCPASYNILHKLQKSAVVKTSVENAASLEQKQISVEVPEKENVILEQQQGSSEITDVKTESSNLENLNDVAIAKSETLHLHKAGAVSKKSNPWANLKHADDEEVNEQVTERPIPRHFDVADDCFAEADSFLESDKNERSLLQHGTEVFVAKTPSKESSVVEVESKDDDFLAACAALKKQILGKKDDDGAAKKIVFKEAQKEDELEKECALKENIDSDQIETVEVEKENPEIDEGVVLESPDKVKIDESDNSSVLCDDEVKPTIVTKEIAEESSCSHEEKELVKPCDSTKTEEKEFLLASSSKAGNMICIWSIGKRGKLQAELHLSGRSQPYKYKSHNWIALLWITPTTLLSSSKQGELISWDLKRIKGKGQGLKPSLIHNDHSSLLFCIAAPVNFHQEEEEEEGEENWRKDQDLRVWTMGQDRCILNTNLGTSREVFISYPSVGGPIQCLVQSPLDPNRVAIGIGDGTARIWDLSKPHVQCVTMTKLWQRMNSKILALSWHPSKEAILAYGTYEGRIGMADTLHPSKSPLLMTQYFNKGIYQLQWGPLKENLHAGLYACSEGKLVVYNSEKPLEDPFVVCTPNNEQITQFTWNQDCNLLVLGAKSGTLFFYKPDFQLLHTTYHQQKSVQCIVWHPEASVESSSYFAWLACSTNDNTFVVYNCRCLFNNDGSGDKEVTIVAELSGHSGSVRCLSWSPHDGNKLVSVGEDSIAQVWDVVTKAIIATYVGHGTEGILAVLWSPLDPDFVITGGRDNTLRIWKVSECPPVECKRESATKTKIDKSAKAESVEDSKTTQSTQKSKKVLETMSRVDGGNTTVVDECRRLFLNKQNLEPCSTEENTYKIDSLDVFRTRDDVLHLLESEEKKHFNAGKRLQAHHISLWKGDISETIKSAIADGSVTPFLISLAPMISPKLWQEACEVYSNKLAESSKSDPLEVAAYFLACHRIEQAIEALVTGGFFREALALTKSRLGEEDPLVFSVLERWAKSSMFDGNFEIAAQCYIALGKLEDAVKLLFRRSDEVTLKLALDIAEHVENEDLYKAVLVRYNAFKNEEKEEVQVEEENISASEVVVGNGNKEFFAEGESASVSEVGTGDGDFKKEYEK